MTLSWGIVVLAIMGIVYLVMIINQKDGDL